MRLIFSLAGLLVVVAIVALLAKKQLQAVQLPAVDGAASTAAVSGTPAQQSQQLQRQVSDDVKKALEQGMRRNEAESNK